MRLYTVVRNLMRIEALVCTGFACLRHRRRIMRYRDKILVRTLFSTHGHLSRSLRRESEAIPPDSGTCRSGTVPLQPVE